MKEKEEFQDRYERNKLEFAQLFSEQSSIRLLQCFFWKQDTVRIFDKRTMNRSFLYVVNTGCITVCTPEKGVEKVGPGQAIYMPAGQTHTAVNIKGNIFKAYGIHFRWQLPGYRTDTRLFADQVLNLPDPDYIYEQLNRLTAVSNLYPQDTGSGLGAAILRNILVDLIFTHETMIMERTDDRVNRAVEMILQNPNRWRDITELAKTVGLSPSRFRVLFRQEMNASPKVYIEKCRLENCASEMITGNLSIKEIAAKHEFSSLQYFNQAFKRHLGCPPRAYRRNHN